MSRTLHPLVLAVVLAAAACTDRTSPEPSSEPPPISGDSPTAARERLAHRIALALRDEKFRAQLKRDLDRSPVREGKLHFQHYLAASHARATIALAQASGETGGAVVRGRGPGAGAGAVPARAGAPRGVDGRRAHPGRHDGR